MLETNKEHLLAHHMRHLACLLNEFTDVVRASSDSCACEDLLRDARSLIQRLAGAPGAGALESIEDAPRDLEATELFLSRWSVHGAQPGCAPVLESASRLALSLRSFVVDIQSTSDGELAGVKRTAQIGRSLMGQPVQLRAFLPPWARIALATLGTIIGLVAGIAGLTSDVIAQERPGVRLVGILWLVLAAISVRAAIRTFRHL